jgi:drug/metabolite transporter (DMT)-like permease
MNTFSRTSIATLALIGVTAGWGLTFPLIKASTESLPPFHFIFFRFTVAGFALLMGAILAKKNVSPKSGSRDEWRAGLILGALLFSGFAFQTLGMQTTTASNAGFITGLSVVLVPLLSLGSGHRIGASSWIGIAVSTVGIGLLSLTDRFAFNPGDLLVLICAVAFALHILQVGKYSSRFDPLRITLIQILVGAGLAGVSAFLLERHRFDWSPLSSAVWVSLLFCGVFATAIAFWIQVAFQRYSTPVRTALIFTCEPVFAALFSSRISNEQLTTRQWAGGTLMVAAMLIAELGPQIWKPADRR